MIRLSHSDTVLALADFGRALPDDALRDDLTSALVALGAADREVAADELADLMSEISEEGWCAGWMSGHGSKLWEIATRGGGDYGMATISPETAALLLSLARRADGWWDGGDEIVPLVDWVTRSTGGQDLYESIPLAQQEVLP